MAIWRDNNIKKIFYALLLMSIGSNLVAQREYHLGSRDAAIVFFHILNNQYCSSIVQFDIFDSLPYTHNIFPCLIDSVYLMHAEGGYVDTSWFDKVHFILIDDTTWLKTDTCYIGSVEIEFDMEYVVLNAIIKHDEYIMNIRDGHPRPAGFLCDCEITDNNTKTICENYKKTITEKINQCKLLWKQQEVLQSITNSK